MAAGWRRNDTGTGHPMPISRRIKEGNRTSEVPLSLDQLPTELYFRIPFDDAAVAATWAESAVRVLQTMTFSNAYEALDRVVLWGSSRSGPLAAGGPGYAFVSELAMRMLRAVGELPIPRAEMVPLSQLEAGLQLYLGAQSDALAYRRIHHD